jgi:hypothetical protein
MYLIFRSVNKTSDFRRNSTVVQCLLYLKVTFFFLGDFFCFLFYSVILLQDSFINSMIKIICAFNFSRCKNSRCQHICTTSYNLVLRCSTVISC